MRRTTACVAFALLAAGCGAAPAEEQPAGEELSGTLTVFAAASLTDVFEDLGEQLTDENPDLEVRFNFAGSSALATQIVEGAPADVFASANEPQMQVVADEQRVSGEPEIFTANVLQIAVPAGNPAGVTELEDFTRAELALALCSPEVPCGSAAEALFEAAGLEPRPDTLEEDVRAALTKVEIGEVDAALVYASDVVSAGDAVEGFDVPEAEDAVNRYPIAVLEDAPNAAAGEAFLALVRSEEAQQALRDAGFRAP